MPQPFPIPIFSPDDLRVIREMIEREKKVPQSTAPRTPLDMQWTEGKDQRTPGGYIVIADYDIEAYDSATHVIHSGWCRLMRNKFDQSKMADVLAETGERVRVHNPTSTAISVGDQFTVEKERFGLWVPSTSNGSPGIWAVVVMKHSKFLHFSVRGKYRCHEIEWLADPKEGTWREKPNGRIFPHCYEASTNSNANIQITKTNVVQLWRVSPIIEHPSSASSGDEDASSFGPTGSSGVHNVDHGLYVFDKALGTITNPERV